MKPFAPEEFPVIPPICALIATQAVKRSPADAVLIRTIEALSRTKGALQAFCAHALNQGRDLLRYADPKADPSSVISGKDLQESCLALSTDPSAMEVAFLEDFSRVEVEELLSPFSTDPFYERNTARFFRPRAAAPELKPVTYGQFQAACRLFARSLPRRLADFVSDPGKGDQFLAAAWCEDLRGLLDAAVGTWAEYCAAAQVETSIGREVSQASDHALQSNGQVIIIGDARLGKTTAARRWTFANPGRVRYVTLEAGQNDRNFYVSIARQLGCTLSPNASTHDALSVVSDVLRADCLTLVIDEAHHLFTSRRAIPKRLEWVRTALANQGVPLVLIATPQFTVEMRHVESELGFNLDQFRGRFTRACVLPADLEEADYLAVAHHLFPGAPRAAIRAAAAYARVGRHYLHSLHTLRNEVFRLIPEGESATEAAMRAGIKACLAADTVLYGLFDPPAPKRRTPPENPTEQPAPAPAASIEFSPREIAPCKGPARAMQPAIKRSETPVFAGQSG